MQFRDWKVPVHWGYIALEFQGATRPILSPPEGVWSLRSQTGCFAPWLGLCPHEQPYVHLGGDTENDIQKIQKISVTPPKFPMYFGDVILSIPTQMSVRLLCEENSLNSQGGSYIQTNEHTKFTGGDAHIRTYERTH